MKKLVILLVFVTWLSSAFAQDSKSIATNQRARYDQIQNAKISFFATALELTPKESDDFWPIYNQYWQSKEKLALRRKHWMSAVDKTIKGTIRGDEKNLRNLFKAHMSYIEADGLIERQLYEDLIKVLPLIKIAKLYKAEEDFRVKIILQLRGDKPIN